MIDDKRRDGWRKSAIKLLRYHDDLDEVWEVTIWLFDKHGGYLPFRARKDERGFYKSQRITNVEQICDNYDECVKRMKAERPVESDQPADDLPTPEDTIPWQPTLNNPPDDDRDKQVAELVDHFAYFRYGENQPDHPDIEFKRNNWAKTFEIMLGHARIPFEDIRTVVTQPASLPGAHRHQPLSRCLPPAQGLGLAAAPGGRSGEAQRAAVPIRTIRTLVV
jgi:hypothetical protein